MPFQGWIRLGGSCVVMLAIVAGCRGTRRPVLDRTAAGIVYDTAHEADLRSGKTPALVSEAWGRYVDTLAEPVGIVGWQEGVSTWEVFFATNRERAFGSSDSGVEFASDVRSTPLYGRAEVTLPKRGRGVDPGRAQSLNRAMPISLTKPKSPDEVVHFESVQLQEREAFLAGLNAQLERSRQKDLLVFVHGFNVDFESAVIRAAQVALDVPFNGAVAAYAWPSQGGSQNYASDEPINQASVEPFTEFLQSLLDGIPPETRVSILVHSMGNRIVMQGINRLAPEARLANVILCAPDVGLADFEAWSPGVVARSERVTLYASENDAALIASKSLHAEQRAGDAHPPVLAKGVETIDCSTVDYTSFLGHSYYGANRQVLGDLFLLLKENRPAGERPHLTKETSGGRDYWVFKGNAPNVLVTWHFEETAK
jgi:esterase/lipase superfamily enzyme